jgi:hypothetical protein
VVTAFAHDFDLSEADKMAKRSTASKTKLKEQETASPAAKKPAKKGEKSSAATAKSVRKTAAQAVRDFMQANPHLRNRDIVRELAVQGIVIDDTIPAQIKSRDKKGRPAKPAATEAASEVESTEKKEARPSNGKSPAEKAAAARRKAIVQPTIFVHSPVHAQFAHDLLAVRTHSQAVKNLRILVARLERIIEMMEMLKDDDWEITLLAQPDGLLFSATHEQAHIAPQIRARLEKLGIQPNEVVVVEVD